MSDQDFNPFDFTRLFSDMKFPGMPDLQALGEANRRNMEALVAANRVAMEGAQTIVRRNMEILQQTLTDMTEGAKALGSSEPAPEKAAKQAELLKQGYQRAVANIQELTELVQRSNGEAVKLLNQRFTEAMEEVKQITQHAPERKG